MSARRLLTAAVALALTAAARADDPTPTAPTPHPAPAPKPAVYHLTRVLVLDVAQTLKDRYPGARVSADVPSNCLIVSATPGQQRQIAELVADLDRKPPSVAVQMLVVKVPAGFASDIGLAEGTESSCVLTTRETRMFVAAIRANKGRCEVLSRPCVQVLDNQTGFVEVGDPNSRLTTQVTPRIMPDGRSVLVRGEVQVTETARAPVYVPTAAGETAAVPVVHIQGSVQTTATVPWDGTVLFRGPMTKPADGPATETLVLMTVVGPLRFGK